MAFLQIVMQAPFHLLLADGPVPAVQKVLCDLFNKTHEHGSKPFSCDSTVHVVAVGDAILPDPLTACLVPGVAHDRINAFHSGQDCHKYGTAQGSAQQFYHVLCRRRDDNSASVHAGASLFLYKPHRQLKHLLEHHLHHGNWAAAAGYP